MLSQRPTAFMQKRLLSASVRALPILLGRSLVAIPPISLPLVIPADSHRMPAAGFDHDHGYALWALALLLPTRRRRICLPAGGGCCDS